MSWKTKIDEHVRETVVPTLQEMKDYADAKAPGTPAAAYMDGITSGFMSGMMYAASITDGGKMLDNDGLCDLVLDIMRFSIENVRKEG